MAASVYSQHYITAVAIKPVLLQVEYKVSQQKNMVVFLLPLDIKRQYALSFPSVSPQKYQQQSSSREASSDLSLSVLSSNLGFFSCVCTDKHAACNVVIFLFCRGSFFVFFFPLHCSFLNIHNCSLQNCCSAVGSLLRLCTPNSLIKNSVSRPIQALMLLLNDFSCRDSTLETMVHCMEMIQLECKFSFKTFVSSDKYSPFTISLLLAVRNTFLANSWMSGPLDAIERGQENTTGNYDCYCVSGAAKFSLISKCVCDLVNVTNWSFLDAITCHGQNRHPAQELRISVSVLQLSSTLQSLNVK